MTVTLELVAVIFLGWLQPKFFYVPVIFGLPYSKIALRPLKNSHPIISFRRNHVPTQAPLHPIVVIDPFPKWGINFMQCKPTSLRGMVILSLSSIISLNGLRLCLHSLTDGRNATFFFVFNHIITRFSVPQAIVTDHGSHF
jgi:hypothetical protein